MSNALKTSYRASSASLYPTYTGGVATLTQDGSILITSVGELQDGLLISDVRAGRRLARVKGDGSTITAVTLAYHTSPPTLITAHQSSTLRYYPLELPTSDAAESSTSSSSSQPPYLSYIRQIPRPHASSPILLLTTSPDSTLIASGASDGSVKVWDVGGGFVTHSFRGHGGAISALSWDFGSGIIGQGGKKMTLLTASTDCKLRIFDLLDPSHRNNNPNAASSSTAGKPVHVLDGHVSTPRGIDVSPDGKWMISGGRDKVVLVWDLQPGVVAANGISHPGSQKKKPTAASPKPKLVQTILARESLESVGLISSSSHILVSRSTGKAVFHGRENVTRGLDEEGDAEERLLCYTGGEKGIVRIWDVLKAKAVAIVSGLGVAGDDHADEDMNGSAGKEEDEDEGEQLGLKDVIYNPSTMSLLAVHHDQNLVLSSLTDNTTTRQIIGFNDEIIDALFLSPVTSSTSTVIPDTHIALATNSNLIRVYDLRSGDARLVDGHSDVVLCLDRTSQGEAFASGSKDNCARVWMPVGGGREWRTVAICEGHAESIGAVAWSRKTDLLTGGGRGKGRFLITASQDKTVKMWDFTALSLATTETLKPKSLTTLKIHEKDINSLAVAPNDAFLASGSQDKLVKVFAITFSASEVKGGASGALKLLGTCKGHKRGVWTVKFSPTDRVLASGAADRTIKLWSLDDFTCLKTFEGHTNSVLRVDFLSAGQQIVSTASDGLVKIWNVKEEECVKTLDNHEDKVWSLAISSDQKRIVSAGADSVITVWEDSTAEELAVEVETKEREVADEQDFNNYLSLRDYRKAIGLALAMGQPGRLLNLFISVHKNRPGRAALTAGSDPTPAEADSISITGSASVDQVLRTLSAVDLVRLLSYVRSWNARAGTSGVAQRVLEGVFRARKGKDLVELFEVAARSSSTSTAGNEEADELDPTAAAAGEDDREQEDGRVRAARRRKAAEIVSLAEWLDGIMPYTERHVQRVERMLRDTYAVDFVLSEMDGLVGEMEVGGGESKDAVNGNSEEEEDVLMLE